MPFRPRSLRSSRPPSPSFSEATNASAINLPGSPAKIITRANLKASLQAYEDLVNTCASYRAALISMAGATAAFADSMERCSSLKGPSYEAATRLQAVSGVHHLVGNLWHVLSASLQENFETPLRQHLQAYKTRVAERSQAYERALRQKSQAIRDTENRNMNRKERNLQTFRNALAILQRQVDELDELKVSHYQEIVEHEEEVWDVVQNQVCIVVRSSMDVFDRITSKASDPVIEPMLQSVPDPFDSYGPPQGEDQIFSILAPLSISMASAPSSATSHLNGSTPERDTIQSVPPSPAQRINSWLPGTNGATYAPEWHHSTLSPSPSPTPPRSTSPPTSASPPSSPYGPNRRNSAPVNPSPPNRMAEAKLRSVLAVIDEGKSRSKGNVTPGQNQDSSALSPSQQQHLNAMTAPRPDPVPDLGWNFAHDNVHQTPLNDATLITLMTEKTPNRPLVIPWPWPRRGSR